MEKQSNHAPDDTEPESVVPGLDEAIGLALRRLRGHMGMSQVELAQSANVSQAWVSLIETGQRNKRPSLAILQRVALALEVTTLSEFIKCAEDMMTVPETQ